MISQATIDNIFGTTIAAAVGIKFVLAEQKLQKQPRPYATYNPILESVESLHQNYRAVAENADDSTKADVSLWEASRATISLQFIGDKNGHIGTLRALANATIDWIRWNRVSGVVLRVLSPQARRLAEWIQQNYEQRLLLDVRVDASEEHVKTYEAPTTIVMGRTEDGDALSDLTIREP